MEVLPDVSLFAFNENTLNSVRNQYGLEKKEILEDSINHLVEWITKQEHFMRKDFSRDYLERTIILSKGSIEKSKVKLDKICTFRTLLPTFFQSFDIENCQVLKDIQVFFLPKMTKDHYRVFMFKNTGQRFDHGFINFYRYVIRSFEFVQANDYCTGIIGIFDYSEANLTEILKSMNFVELQQAFSLVITIERRGQPLTFTDTFDGMKSDIVPYQEGYGMRIKGLHFITSSKAIDILIGLIKKIVSSKVGDRIRVHQTREGIYDFIPKEILPCDYGGEEKCSAELQLEMKKILFSEKFNKYFNNMNEARTNEAVRSEEKFNNQCMGMPGSFRKLSVD